MRAKNLIKIMNDNTISVELETYVFNREYFDELQEVELSKQQLIDIIFTGNIEKYCKRSSK